MELAAARATNEREAALLEEISPDAEKIQEIKARMKVGGKKDKQILAKKYKLVRCLWYYDVLAEKYTRMLKTILITSM